MITTQFVILVSALAVSNVLAQAPNTLVANWLAKETTDFERAELLRNNEVKCFYWSIP